MTRCLLVLVILSLAALPGVVCGSWIKDKVYLQTDTVGKVEFSHYAHMEKSSKGKDCTVCHNRVYHIVKKKNPVFSMADMEKGRACGFCHNDKQAFGVKANCTLCHAGDVIYASQEAGNVVFSHELHGGIFGCGECHPELFFAEKGASPSTMGAMESGESCGACHDGSTAFSVAGDCDSCHEM